MKRFLVGSTVKSWLSDPREKAISNLTAISRERLKSKSKVYFQYSTPAIGDITNSNSIQDD